MIEALQLIGAAIAAAVLFLMVPAMCVVYSVKSIRSRRISFKSGWVERDADPGFFWATISLYNFFALFLLGLAGRAVLLFTVGI